MRAAALQVEGVGALAVQRVRRDHGSARVSDGVKHRHERGQFDPADHLDLGDGQPIGVVEGGQQLGLLAILGAGAAHRLAVDRQQQTPCRAGSAMSFPLQ